LPVWTIEFRANFDVEFEGEVAGIGQVDSTVVHIWFGDCGDIATFGDLLKAIHDQAAFDLIGDRFFESGFEEFARNFTLAEAWQIGSGSDFAVGFAEVTVDLTARNRHDDVPLASGRLLDFDLDI
jgi:hypothetical protein